MFDTTHLHPMIVHFPIALIIVGFLAEVLSLIFRSDKFFSKAGFYLMVLGALAALASWLTGQLFTNKPAAGEIVNIFEKHETAATITMIVMLLGAAFKIYLVARKKEETNLKWIVFGLYFIGFAAISITGFLGGTMVFNYMIGL